MPPPMGMPPRPPGFMPPPMQYSAMLSKPPELSKQSEDGKKFLIYCNALSYALRCKAVDFISGNLQNQSKRRAK